jgi:hypothetical protein
LLDAADGPVDHVCSQEYRVDVPRSRLDRQVLGVEQEYGGR